MEDVEKWALSTYPLPLPFWKGYVDDTLTALPQDKVQRFHEHLNSIETTIQFTVEMESEGTRSFLDTMIMHHFDESLSTTVFRKSTDTDKYLDFPSHQQLAHKVAVAHTLFVPSEKICLDFPDSEKEKNILKGAQNNKFPIIIAMAMYAMSAHRVHLNIQVYSCVCERERDFFSVR